MKAPRPEMLAAILPVIAAAWLFSQSAGSELVILAMNPDGSPAKGVKVQQVQLERSSPFPRNFQCGVTDGEGRLTVKYQPMKSQGDERNGYGIYRFVLMPADCRWELSDLYYWNKEPWTELTLAETDIWSYESYREIMEAPQSSDTNWSVGSLTRLVAGERLIWKVSLQPGRDVQVSVVDQFDEPLAGKSFSVILDTGVLSHTGFGGEIRMFPAATDDRGRLVLPRAGNFRYSFDYACGTKSVVECDYCAPGMAFFTTIVSGRFDGADGAIRYYRRVPVNLSVLVRDKASQSPVPGAEISLIVLFSSARQGGTLGKTDSEGRLTLDKLFLEHSVSLVAKKEGYRDLEFDLKDFVPGTLCTLDLERRTIPLRYRPRPGTD